MRKSVINSSNQKSPFQKVIIIIGNNGTGKTCLLTQLTKQRVSKSYISTYGADYYLKEYTTKQNKKMSLALWDTNGSEKEVSILPSRLYASASAFIIMCSYDNIKSYQDLAEWIEFYRNQRDKSGVKTEFNNKRLTTIVVINKKDIKDKKFKKEDVQELIHKNYPTVFICELSTFNEKKVKLLFTKITKLITKNEDQGDLTFDENEITKIENDIIRDNSTSRLKTDDNECFDLFNSSIRIEKVYDKKCGNCCYI